jgi:hypothetical protein
MEAPSGRPTYSPGKTRNRETRTAGRNLLAGRVEMGSIISCGATESLARHFSKRGVFLFAQSQWRYSMIFSPEQIDDALAVMQQYLDHPPNSDGKTPEQLMAALDQERANWIDTEWR